MPRIPIHTLNLNDITTPIYCGMDSLSTHEIESATRDIVQDNNAELSYSFKLGMQAPALEMMLRGFRVDPIARDAAITAAKQKRAACEEVLDRLVRAVTKKDYNPKFPRSNTQLKEFFYEYLGLKSIQRREKGEVKTPMNRATLEKLEAYFYARPFINGILLHRDLDKTLEVLETEIDKDMRWRCSYNVAGPSTDRWSSSKSGLGTGNNFQNISEELRRIFIADKGYKLGGVDLEQADARNVGWYCGTILGDWSYLDACESGDLHTSVTRLVYPNWPWTGDLKKDRKLADRKFYRHLTYRDASKRLGHGTNFLGQPAHMAAETKIPPNLVKDFYEAYMTAFPCINKMHHNVAKDLQMERALTNAYGLRRDFFNRADAPETLRAAIAHLFQSATGHNISVGLWRIWKHMGTRIQLLSQLHDAIYFQYREDDNEEEIFQEVKQHMAVTLKYGERSFTIPSDAVYGYNWAHRYRLDDEGNLIDWNKKGLDKVRFT